jgi:hypothetical protein
LEYASEKDGIIIKNVSNPNQGNSYSGPKVSKN